MNEQFTKTLDALEAAENEMTKLHNILDGLEIRSRASWHETQAVAGLRDKLKTMQASIRAMLGKREEEMLRGLRAEQRLHLGGGNSAAQLESPNQTIPQPKRVGSDGRVTDEYIEWCRENGRNPFPDWPDAGQGFG